MEFCHGQNWQDANLPELQTKERRQLWMEAIRVMAKMHSIEPSKIGLADYGKQGFEMAK
jgi:aminoglycoside phosphotransferase (APT) family kinase protein